MPTQGYWEDAFAAKPLTGREIAFLPKGWGQVKSAKAEVPRIVAPSATNVDTLVARNSELVRLNRDMLEANNRLLAVVQRQRDVLKSIGLETDDPGEHEYQGPVKDGASVPDVVHERFHRAIGDVLGGKVMPKAREQMEKALKRQPPDAPTTATKSKPMPGRALAFDKQAVGILVPLIPSS